MILTALLAYFILLILSGIFLSRKNLNFDDYFFGGRKLGSILIFFTITASWFGAASTIATFEDAVKNGFRSVWLLGIPTVTTILFFILLNKKIRKTNFVSLPGLLKERYGPLVASIASFLIFFYMTLLAASQFIAWGRFVGPVIGEHYSVTIFIGALIVILYSYIGGYLSVVFTDGLQFFLLISAIIILLVFFFRTHLPFHPGDFHLLEGIQKNMLMTISFTLAWIISPIVWQRISSAKSGAASRRGLLFSVAVFILLYAAIIVTAISIRTIPGAGFETIIKHLLPQWAGIVVFLGIAAAIMSTADTAINLGALTLVKDIFPVSSSPHLIGYSKAATFASGIIAVLIAIKFNSIIKTLGLASEIMAEGLFIPGMAALFLRNTKPLAGLFSLTAGGIFAIAVFLKSTGLPLPVPDWPESLPTGLMLSALGFAVGFLLDRSSKSEAK
jgi:SSS family solute:Na+ symporter